MSFWSQILNKNSFSAIGQRGETVVSDRLFVGLNPDEYTILNDIMLPTNRGIGTAQIDHIVVSNYGIFCIETKAHFGSIYGSHAKPQWKQYIKSRETEFYNPILQNGPHMQAIQNILSRIPLTTSTQIYGLVAFPNAKIIKVFGTQCVGKPYEIVSKILSIKHERMSDEQKYQIIRALRTANITDNRARESHNSSAQSFKSIYSAS